MHAILHARRQFETVVATMRENGSSTLAIEHHILQVQCAFRQWEGLRHTEHEEIGRQAILKCFCRFESAVLSEKSRRAAA